MAYVASKKQALAHKAFMVDGFKRGVLLMGRQCLAPDTLVKTDKGHKPISEIEVGDLVRSFGDGWEYKEVLHATKYGVDVEPKPMLQFVIYEETIKATYDHPFYFDGYFIPIYQLAWGNMEASQRQKLELLCEQYGQTLDYEAIRWVQDSNYEAWIRHTRILADGSGQEDNKDAPTNGSDLDSEPQQPTRSESQEQHQDGQPSRESRVGNPQREHTAHPQIRESRQQAGDKLWDTYIDGEAGVADTQPERKNYSERIGKEIRSIPLYNLGHPSEKELVSHITVSECEDTYSIEIDDNHNYCITKKNILVMNSGKTFFATQHAWINATIAQGRYFIVFKTYKQAHEVVWRQYVPLIPKELIYKTNEQELLITLNYIEDTPIKLPSGETIIVNHDKNKPRSTIQLLGSDQSDSHRGFRADGMIFDEYADQDPDNFKVVYEPMFSTTNGWIIFMGTPRGYNHFYDLIQFAKEDEKWFYQEATWRDSPYVSRDFMENVKKEAEKRGMLSGFMQEYELEFRSVQGAVYPSFDRKVHVIKPSDIPLELTYYGAIDFGWHTTAFLLFGVDKDQTWYLIDEVYGKEETLDNVMPRIKQVIGDKRLVLIVADSANRDAIEVMQRDYPVVGVNKANDVKGYGLGIGLVTEKLKPRMQLVGIPKPSLYVGSNCTHFIYEIEAYRFPEDKPDRNPSDIPVKEDDHGPDAARYLFLHLKFGVPKDDKPLVFEMDKMTNSYGIL